MKDTRTLRLFVHREEKWYPEVEVPADLDDTEAYQWAKKHCFREIHPISPKLAHHKTYSSNRETRVVNKYGRYTVLVSESGAA